MKVTSYQFYLLRFVFHPHYSFSTSYFFPPYTIRFLPHTFFYLTPFIFHLIPSAFYLIPFLTLPHLLSIHAFYFLPYSIYFLPKTILLSTLYHSFVSCFNIFSSVSRISRQKCTLLIIYDHFIILIRIICRGSNFSKETFLY